MIKKKERKKSQLPVTYCFLFGGIECSLWSKTELGLPGADEVTIVTSVCWEYGGLELRDRLCPPKQNPEAWS